MKLLFGAGKQTVASSGRSAFVSSLAEDAMRKLVVMTWVSTLFPFLLAAAAPLADTQHTYKVSRWDEAWRPQRFGRSARGGVKDAGWRPQRFGRGRHEGWRPQRFGRNEGLTGLQEVLSGEVFPLLQLSRTSFQDDLPAMNTGYTSDTVPARLRSLPFLHLSDHDALRLVNGDTTNRVFYPPQSRMVRAEAESLHGFGYGGQHDIVHEVSPTPPRNTDDWLAEIQRLGLRGRKRREVSSTYH